MKEFSLLGAILASALVGTLGAADPTIYAPLDRVTVYPSDALLTHRVSVDLSAGQQAVHFRGLPLSLRDETLQVRVSGASNATLLNTGVEVVQQTGFTSERREELESKLEDIEVRLTKLEAERSRVTARAQLLGQILQFHTHRGEEAADLVPLDAPHWIQLMEFQDEILTENAEQIQRLDQETSVLKRESDRIRREIKDLGNQSQAEKRVTVNLDSSRGGNYEFEFSYLASQASWAPVYTLRATDEGDEVALDYQASVRQRTGIDWDNVAVELSTSTPSRLTRVPELWTWRVDRYEEPELYKARSGFGATAAPMMEMAMADEAAAMEPEARVAAPPPVAVDASLTETVFKIPYRATVRSDNQQQRLSISTINLKRDIERVCVPKITDDVFIEASIVNDSEFPLLPGRARVVMDGNYVTEIPLDYVPTGKEFEAPLGIDRAITVKREELTEKSGESGLFKKMGQEPFAFVYEIENSRPESLFLTLVDHIPVSGDEKIKVTLKEPEADDAGVTLEEDGEIRRRISLAAKQKKELRLAFEVEYPRDWDISGL